MLWIYYSFIKWKRLLKQSNTLALKGYKFGTFFSTFSFLLSLRKSFLSCSRWLYLVSLLQTVYFSHIDRSCWTYKGDFSIFTNSSDDDFSFTRTKCLFAADVSVTVFYDDNASLCLCCLFHPGFRRSVTVSPFRCSTQVSLVAF